MAISITHPFVSAKVDGTDPTVVQPSNWNDAHTITMASGVMLARTSAGIGPAQEISFTALPTMGTVGDFYIGTSGGYFTAGASAASWKTSLGADVISWNYSTGAFTATGNITAYSDARLKKGVVTIDNALDLVEQMRGVYYTRVDTEEPGVGVIAQELQRVLPELVHDDGDYLSVAYGNLVGVLVEAVKELSARVAELERV